MTREALAEFDRRPEMNQRREEFDRPEREGELIADALRRRAERLAPLKKAFAGIVVHENPEQGKERTH